MKNRGIAGIVSLSLIALLVCPSASAENRRKFSLGINTGGAPVGASSSPALRTGVEVGFRMGRRLALVGTVSYGTQSLETNSTSGYYYSKETQTWSAIPAALVVRYEAVLSDSVLVSIGAGAAYASLDRTVESETNSTGKTQTSTSEQSFHAWMPRFEIALELFIGKALSLTAALGYEFGKAEQQSAYYSLRSVNEFSFGGPTVVAGARVYLF